MPRRTGREGPLRLGCQLRRRQRRLTLSARRDRLRRDPVRRPQRARQVRAAAPRRLRVPALRAVPAHERARQRALRPQGAPARRSADRGRAEAPRVRERLEEAQLVQGGDRRRRDGPVVRWNVSAQSEHRRGNAAIR